MLYAIAMGQIIRNKMTEDDVILRTTNYHENLLKAVSENTDNSAIYGVCHE